MGSSHLFKCALLKRQSVAVHKLDSLFSCFNLCVGAVSFSSIFLLLRLSFATQLCSVCFFLLSNNFPLFIFCNDLRTFLLLFVGFHGGDATVAVPASCCSSCHFFFLVNVHCLCVCASVRVLAGARARPIVVLFLVHSLSIYLCLCVLLLFATKNATDFLNRFLVEHLPCRCKSWFHFLSIKCNKH